MHVLLLLTLLIAWMVLLCFAFVLLFGAPFLPTLKPQINSALDLLNLKPGQVMLELGCGDGRVLIAAAEQGVECIGYELNPLLAGIAWLRTRKYGPRVRVYCADYWSIDWPRADAAFAFILPRYMGKLHKKVMQYPYRPLRVASFAFEVPHQKSSRVHNGVYLYEYK